MPCSGWLGSGTVSVAYSASRMKTLCTARRRLAAAEGPGAGADAANAAPAFALGWLTGACATTASNAGIGAGAGAATGAATGAAGACAGASGGATARCAGLPCVLTVPRLLKSGGCGSVPVPTSALSCRAPAEPESVKFSARNRPRMHMHLSPPQALVLANSSLKVAQARSGHRNSHDTSLCGVTAFPAHLVQAALPRAAGGHKTREASACLLSLLPCLCVPGVMMTMRQEAAHHVPRPGAALC